MGSWGVAVFADDLALDVRGDWRDALLGGEDPADASRRLAGRLGEPVEWIALAAAQHETGHLQDDVRDRALASFDADLALWEDPQRARRRAVLDRLAAKLNGPQLKPKRLRGPRVVDPGVAVGDIVRVGTVLFAVIGIERHPLVLALYGDDPEGPYLSDLDFSAFRGDEPPPSMPIATRALNYVIGPLEHGGAIVARGVQRPDEPGGCGSMTGWPGLQSYSEPRVQRILRRVTECRLERYGPRPDAWRIERDARLAEHERLVEEHLGPGPITPARFIEFLTDGGTRRDRRSPDHEPPGDG